MKNRYVNTKFWSDNFVVEELNPLDRYIFLYLLTNDKTNMSGIYEIPLRTMANETGVDREELLRMLKRLEPKVYYFDGWIYVTRFVEHQGKNPNIEKSIIDNIKNIPSNIRSKIIEVGIESERLSKAFKGFQRVKKTLNYLNSNSNLNNTNKLVLLDDDKKKKSRVLSTDIDEMFRCWYNEVGYEVTSRVKENRSACSDLIKEYGKEGLKRMIHGVALASENQYAPRVANFIDLHKRWDELKLWGKKHITKTSTQVGVVE